MYLSFIVICSKWGGGVETKSRMCPWLYMGPETVTLQQASGPKCWEQQAQELKCIFYSTSVQQSKAGSSEQTGLTELNKTEQFRTKHDTRSNKDWTEVMRRYGTDGEMGGAAQERWLRSRSWLAGVKTESRARLQVCRRGKEGNQ